MTSTANEDPGQDPGLNPDQDAEPPTPDGQEPDPRQLDPDTAEPASDPDPAPGEDE